MADRPENFEGVITIEWSPGPSPMPGWRFAPRAEDGTAITTVTELTIHASAQGFTWAEMTMFADKDSRPLYDMDGAFEHVTDGIIPEVTFPFLVGGMSVREPSGA